MARVERFNPDFFVARRAGVHVHNDALVATLAVKNGKSLHIQRRTPVLQERFHRILVLRIFRRRPQVVSGLIIVRLQQVEEAFHLLFLREIIEKVIREAGDHRYREHRQDGDLHDPRPPFVSGAVIIQKAGH